MALSKDEVRAHAVRLIQENHQWFDFSNVYLDGELERLDVQHGDLVSVHDAILAAQLTVTWED